MGKNKTFSVSSFHFSFNMIENEYENKKIRKKKKSKNVNKNLPEQHLCMAVWCWKYVIWKRRYIECYSRLKFSRLYLFKRIEYVFCVVCLRSVFLLFFFFFCKWAKICLLNVCARAHFGTFRVEIIINKKRRSKTYTHNKISIGSHFRSTLRSQDAIIKFKFDRIF